MAKETQESRDESVADPADVYESPELTCLGTVADLTEQQKTVGSADGATFLGLDIGS